MSRSCVEFVLRSTRSRIENPFHPSSCVSEQRLQVPLVVERQRVVHVEADQRDIRHLEVAVDEDAAAVTDFQAARDRVLQDYSWAGRLRGFDPLFAPALAQAPP